MLYMFNDLKENLLKTNLKIDTAQMELVPKTLFVSRIAKIEEEMAVIKHMNNIGS